MSKEKHCINCKFVENMQAVVTTYKCNNQNSDLYGDYVDPRRGSCERFEPWKVMPQEQYIKIRVDEISKLNNKKPLKTKIEESYKYYQERLDEEKEILIKLQNGSFKVKGRIEVLIDIIDDLKHDLEGEDE